MAFHARAREEFANSLTKVEKIQTFNPRIANAAGIYSARLLRVRCYSRPSGRLFQTRESIHRSTELKTGATARRQIEKTLLKLLTSATQTRHHRAYGYFGDTRDFDVR